MGFLKPFTASMSPVAATVKGNASAGVQLHDDFASPDLLSGVVRKGKTTHLREESTDRRLQELPDVARSCSELSVYFFDEEP